MRRRDIIAGLASAAVLPNLARAQQPSNIPVVGMLWPEATEQRAAVHLRAFRNGLADLAYIEGKNVVLESHFAAAHYYRFEGLAAELVRLKVDVLVAITPLAAKAAAQRTTSTIAIVFVANPDPLAAELVIEVPPSLIAQADEVIE